MPGAAALPDKDSPPRLAPLSRRSQEFTPVHAATFAAVFIALYVAHSVGDHWVQTSHQSANKGRPGWVGRFADTRHVATLTLTKLAVLIPAAMLLGLHLSVLGLVAGLGIDAVTHWWADRRSTLAWDPGELHLMHVRVLAAGPELREVYRLAA
ncbi:hypothetical protein GCM10012285_64190 [Streptomyces kronopolitis]|uniref:DUF3307 domain-containing protein n=1 Tax=Streptomyces kronopolitis TaxID=1612435 RepID=A0ABQ2K405_9ACTN|nr:hypothetical protein GCM10012285_64190 [Streptomyces kronopolitis]